MLHRRNGAMKIYNIDEAFELLERSGITTHVASVRRWLRNGDLKGTIESKRKGWEIKEKDLFDFISRKNPLFNINVTNDKIVKDQNNISTDTIEKIKEEAREKMWWEIVKKGIFEDCIEIKKGHIKEVLEHRQGVQHLDRVWNVLKGHKMGRAKPIIFYLLDYFLYDGKRIAFDNLHVEQYKILFPLVEYVLVNSKS